MIILQEPDIDIEPASYDQVKISGEDNFIIEESIGDIVKQLKEIDDRFVVTFNRKGKFYCLWTEEPITGKRNMVKTFLELDQRIVKRIKKIVHPSYSAADELDKMDAATDRDNQRKMDDWAGETAERLAFALRKDFGLTTNKAFITNGLSDTTE